MYSKKIYTSFRTERPHHGTQVSTCGRNGRAARARGRLSVGYIQHRGVRGRLRLEARDLGEDGTPPSPPPEVGRVST